MKSAPVESISLARSGLNPSVAILPPLQQPKLVRLVHRLPPFEISLAVFFTLRQQQHDDQIHQRPHQHPIQKGTYL